MTGAEFSGVDIDLLADYIGGALEGTPDESVVATLIAEDPQWRDAYETLGGGVAAVRAELGRFDAEPMPDDLAARLDGMFSAPALTLVKGDAAAEGAEPRSRRRRWVTPTAIAAGFIAFVGFGADYLAGRDGLQSNTSADSAAGGSAETAISAAPAILASGLDYTRATLAIEPPRPLVDSGKSSASTLDDSSAGNQDRTLARASELGRLDDPAALQDCLDAIERENAGGTIAVQTVDYARFDGVPALIVRFVAENGAWAWAAGADCGTSVAGADAIDKVPVR